MNVADDHPPPLAATPLVVARGNEGALASAPVSCGAVVPQVVRARAIFREQAVDAYLETARRSEVLRIAPPWARGSLAVATLLVLGALCAAFVVEVEQTARARGVLRVAGGVQLVTSQTAGVVVDVESKSGASVDEGARLATIDSTATKTSLLEAEHEIARAEDEVSHLVAHRDRRGAERVALLRERIGILEARGKSQAAATARLRGKLASFDRLLAEKLAPANERVAIENELAEAERASLAVDEQVSETRLQIANISADIAKELDQKRLAVVRAKDHREALVFQLAQTEIHAPRAGRIEALVVKPGDSVAVGAVVARIVPRGAPRQIVVFLPEADRAFLKEGAEVAIELDQLPAGEFGSLDAKVSRVALDLATQAEIAEALGDTKLGEPTFRVELELVGGDKIAAIEEMLRPGSLLTARFVLRKRRLVTLFFEPLRRFFR
jgi:multidrug resistance efflux pump